MDVERTIEFILHMQAKAELRMAKADERAAKADERAAKADERMDKFDKRLEATRKLVEVGLRLGVKIRQEHRELAREVRALNAQQLKTSRDLDRLINSWTKRPTNGHRPTA